MGFCSEFMYLIKVKFNKLYSEIILESKIKSELNYKNDLFKLLSNYFIVQSNEEIKDFNVCEISNGISNQIIKRRKNRKYSNQFALPHQNAIGSNIELLFEEGLKSLAIKYKSQHEIYKQGRLLSIIDFFIEDHNIAIYCDGFQYHYNKETVIKDRQQDRKLQLMGITVLRYTGSEIVGNLNECLRELKEFIDKLKI